MSIKTFWMILIKILGLFLISGALIVLPQSVSSIYYAFKNVDLTDIISICAINITLLFIYGLVIRLFICRTSWIISKLKLDKDFENERIELNFDATKIISIATIVIGGLIFIDSFPVLLREIIIFFQDKNLFKDYPRSGWIIFHFCKVIIGYLIMTNSLKIANVVIKKSNTNQSEM